MAEKPIWKKEISLGILNEACSGTMVEHVGIEFVEIGPDYLRATMPVRTSNTQPMGLLHGGASVVLVETVCSMAGSWCAAEGKFCAGVEINTNHLKAKRSGTVTGTARPVRIGGTIQVWSCEIADEEGDLVAVGRITMAVVGDRIGQ